MKTAKELFDELNSWDENRRIEAKSASAVGKSMMETVCAFANEPGCVVAIFSLAPSV